MTESPLEAAARLDLELEHYDRTQLWFQLHEIVVDAVYERQGVTVEPGDVIFDVGANVGVAAAYFASVRGAGSVHAFEPAPRIYELLRRNLERHPCCVAHPYGLGREEGAVTLAFYPDAAAMSSIYADPESDRELTRTAMINLGASAEAADAELGGRYEPEPVRIELRTLSGAIGELGIDRIDLLKVDVEKAEHDVLAGIDEADWPRVRQLVMEVHDIQGRLAAVQTTLRERGFEVTVDQSEIFAGTPLYDLYATR